MLVEKKHLEFISRIYDVVLEPNQWQPVLDEFFPHIGCKGGNLVVDDHNMKEVSVQVVGSSYTPEQLQEFAEHYAETEVAAIQTLARYPVHHWIDDEKAFGVPESDNPSSQFMRKYGHHGRQGTRLNDSRAWFDAMVVSYGVDRPTMTQEEKLFSHLFLPHLAKAIETTRPFLVLKHRFNAVLEALDRFHTGVFILTPAETIIVANKEGNRILEDKDGFTKSRNDKLRCLLDAEKGAFSGAVQKACATSSAQGQNNGTRMVVSRKSGDTPYLVEVAPLCDTQGQSGEIIRGALVYVNAPLETGKINVTGLDILFKLTESEGETCRLLTQGFSTNEIADIRNVRPDTVRDTLKAIYGKTNARNQADLVRLALMVNLPIDTV